MTKCGCVALSVAPSPTGVEIVIADTGAGISADLLPHIFEPFRQGTSSAADPHRGLGLGLAIVRHLIEMHGGTIAASSEGAGCGAQFRITLPAHATEADAPIEGRDVVRAQATSM